MLSRVGITKFLVTEMADLDIGEKEHGYLNAATIAHQIGVGPFIKQFEETWSRYNGYRYGVACNSGTSALHLAVLAAGGHRILVPNFTMAGTAWPVLYDKFEVEYYPTRADLPLAEHDIDTTGFDVIIFAHIYGRRAYPEGFVKKLKEKNPALIVIDDMAEAHGVIPEGDIACYSFYANKILAAGEGGMCLTNSEFIADEMRSLANMYFDKDRSMIHPKIGHNYRMTNLHAAVGLAQVERVEEILEKRKKIEAWYDKHLPQEFLLPKRDTLWYYDIKVHNAEKTAYSLKKQGVPSRRMFYPCSLQPWGNGTPDDNGLHWYKHGLLLPTYNKMDEPTVRWICETLVAVAK